MEAIKPTTQITTKETWNKPELEAVSVKENTLAGASVGGDGSSQS